MEKYSIRQKQEANDDTPKKVYKTPQLTTVGNIKELTLGAGSVNYDEGSLVPDFS